MSKTGLLSLSTYGNYYYYMLNDYVYEDETLNDDIIQLNVIFIIERVLRWKRYYSCYRRRWRLRVMRLWLLYIVLTKGVIHNAHIFKKYNFPPLLTFLPFVSVSGVSNFFYFWLGKGKLSAIVSWAATIVVLDVYIRRQVTKMMRWYCSSSGSSSNCYTESAATALSIEW